MFTVQKKTRKAKNKTVFERHVTLIEKIRLRQQMNLLKKKADKVIALKKTQIVKENSLVNFDLENPMSFLHFNSFI